jgi:hypothetical protein
MAQPVIRTWSANVEQDSGLRRRDLREDPCVPDAIETHR